MKKTQVAGTNLGLAIVFGLVTLLLALLSFSVQAQGTATNDYGDAPDTYGEAFQEAGDLIKLGSCNDAEMSSLYSDDALGDDVDPTTACPDDGISFSQANFADPGVIVTAVVTYTQYGHIDSFISFWVDLDGDGNFSDMPGDFSERIYESGPIYRSGQERTLTFTYTVPVTATPQNNGRCYARLAFRSDANVDPTGTVSDLGEIEDYAVACATTTAVSLVDNSVAPHASYSVVVTAALFVLMGATALLFRSTANKQ